ncbi:hypothetical protein ACLB0R_04545 [Sphingomonas sp. GlSt437]
MSSASYYAWEVRFGGPEVSGAIRPRAPDAENAQLMRPLAETMPR